MSTRTLTTIAIPQLEQVKANVNKYPVEISADNGYYSGKNLVYLAERGIDAYIPDENTVIAEKGGKGLPEGEAEILR